MKRMLWPVLILGLSAALYGCSAQGNTPAAPSGGSRTPETGQNQVVDEKTEKEAVIQLVQDFGKNGFAAAERLSEDRYKVQGEIIEITSTEQEDAGVAAKRPIQLEIRKIDNRWLIDAVTLGEYAEAEPAASAYVNTEYGFQFALPESWQGCTIVTDEWEGTAAEGSPSDLPALTGPMISIRHPAWTVENPRQDIPILVFTRAQWDALQQEHFHIGAAPVGPSELGRNSEYVFALPARYNYAFPAGYEEVEEILKNQPLKPM